MTSIGAAFLAELGLVSVRDMTQKHRPPLPSELLAAFVVFGALGALAIPAPRAAGLVGWGLVLSTLLSSRVDVLKPIGDFLGGGYAVANASSPTGAGGGFAGGGGGGGGSGSSGGW